ncbi:hypothetical protein PIB30_027369 [Stylosanthes scabra]|uniref:Retrotransposon Copia-like N-terminal domain-containing protein n=1 Tax=Stylosanthes scabra TaxID=79078 RepID=A0ABU6SAU1_9FABA|nr:hypothetical protein [Stylosanthes scabra]
MALSLPIVNPCASIKNFLIPIADKLNDSNYVTWQRQALFEIGGQRLEDHIIEGKAPSAFDSDAAKIADTKSIKFQEWKQSMTTLCVPGLWLQLILISRIELLIAQML